MANLYAARFARRLVAFCALIIGIAACQSTDDPRNGGVANAEGQADAAGMALSQQQDFYDTIFFDADSSALGNRAILILQSQAALLNNRPELSAVLAGHTDERGPREFNFMLGAQRADAAANYLQSLGVAPNRLRTISFGKTRPAVPGTGPQVWALNRRVTTQITP